MLVELGLTVAPSFKMGLVSTPTQCWLTAPMLPTATTRGRVKPSRLVISLALPSLSPLTQVNLGAHIQPPQVLQGPVAHPATTHPQPQGSHHSPQAHQQAASPQTHPPQGQGLVVPLGALAPQGLALMEVMQTR